VTESRSVKNFYSIVSVIQSVRIRQETNFYDKNTCFGIELTKQVQLFEHVISTGFFPGPQSQNSFLDLYLSIEKS
jgi:hypothetical protein